MKTLFTLIDNNPYISIGALTFIILYFLFLYKSIKKVKENRDYYKPNNDFK